jgi:hypothetical protein
MSRGNRVAGLCVLTVPVRKEVVVVMAGWAVGRRAWATALAVLVVAALVSGARPGTLDRWRPVEPGTNGTVRLMLRPGRGSLLTTSPGSQHRRCS